MPAAEVGWGLNWVGPHPNEWGSMAPPGGSGVAPLYMRDELFMLRSWGGSAPNMAGPAPCMSRSAPSSGDPGGSAGRCWCIRQGGEGGLAAVGCCIAGVPSGAGRGGCSAAAAWGPGAGGMQMGGRTRGSSSHCIAVGLRGGWGGGAACKVGAAEGAAAGGSIALPCRESLLAPVRRFLGCCLMTGSDWVLVGGVGVAFLLAGADAGACSPALEVGLQLSRWASYMHPGMERSQVEQNVMWGMPCCACRHGMRVKFAGNGAQAAASSSAMSASNCADPSSAACCWDGLRLPADWPLSADANVCQCVSDWSLVGADESSCCPLDLGLHWMQCIRSHQANTRDCITVCLQGSYCRKRCDSAPKLVVPL